MTSLVLAWLVFAVLFESSIWIEGELYMRRYPVVASQWLTVRLHRIRLPDARQPRHNHPFRWAGAVILWGGYDEVLETPSGLVTKHHRAPCVNWIGGPGTYHRIEVVLPNTLTLFVAGPRTGSWGFKISGHHVPSDKFLGKESRHG